MSRLIIKTVNPRALKETIESLPGGTHRVDVDTYDGEVVMVETSNPDFLRFACGKQGYGEVVGP